MRLDPDQSWPDHGDHEAFTLPVSEIRRWAESSVRRALSTDDRFLWLARSHATNPDGTVVSLPGVGVGRRVLCIDVVSLPNRRGYRIPSVALPDGCWVDRLVAGPDGIRVCLTLRGPLADILGLSPGPLELACPADLRATFADPSRPLVVDDALLELAAFLRSAHRETPRILALAAQRDEAERVLSPSGRASSEAGLLRTAAAASGRFGVPPERKAEFEAAVERFGVGEGRKALERAAMPCIRLAIGPAADPGVRGSRLGGPAWRRQRQRWPGCDGEAFTFVAGLDLEQLPRLRGMPLPREGLLSFFTGSQDNAEAFVTLESDLERLRPVAQPEGKPRDPYQKPIVAAGLVASIGVDFPSVSGVTGEAFGFAGLPEDELERCRGVIEGFGDRPFGKIGGYPAGEDGIRRLRGDGGTVDHLLLGVDSWVQGNVCWWDAGVFHFVVTDIALRRGDFAQVRGSIDAFG